MGKSKEKVPEEPAEEEESEDEQESGGDDAGLVEQPEMLDLDADCKSAGPGLQELTISKKFARRYNEQKDKEELSRAKRILDDEDEGSDEGTESEEDEDAELLTSRVEDKIFDTLRRIRSKDPSIYDKDKRFFDDDDWETETHGGSSSSTAQKKPGMKYKDFLRDTLMKEGADALVNEEEKYEQEEPEEEELPETSIEIKRREEADLRRSLVEAAHGSEEEDGGDEEEAGGLFKVSKEVKQGKTFGDFQKKKGVGQEAMYEAGEVAKYWNDDDVLDDEERFLRDFVINKTWQDTGSMHVKKDDDDDVGSEEDEKHLEKTDDFEKDYNFRFEMEDGCQIVGHQRFPENSVREKPDKRKKQRQAKAERKDADGIRRVEELKRLKNLKKQEIARRLERIKEVTGNAEIPLGKSELDTDFDPDAHEQHMSSIFNEEYDEAEDPLEGDELLQAHGGGGDELDVSGAAAESVNKRRKKEPVQEWAGEEEVHEDEGGEHDHDAEGGTEDWQEEEWGDDGGDEGGPADPEEWWMCDMCKLGIPGGKQRFDCTVCADFTLCKKCFRVRKHRHKFARKRVPEGSMPPEELQGAEADQDNMEEVMDEYFNLDYEDIIGGDLPTRFKYQKVTANDCGMTADDILHRDDKELNRVMPLKMLRTYRTDNHKVRQEGKWKMKQLKVEKVRAKNSWFTPQAAEPESTKRKRKPKEQELPEGMTKDRLDAFRLGADRKYGNQHDKSSGSRGR